MTQELTPNTQITQENVGLLKAGDRVKVSYYGTQWDGVGTVVDFAEASHEIGGRTQASIGVERKDVGTGNFTPDCITFLSRPALSPPAEGSDPILDAIDRDTDQAELSGGRVGASFAAEDACLACNSPAPVDWNVVGPKLVGALDGIVHFTDGFGFYRTQSPPGIALEQWIDEADALLKEIDPDRGLALAATQSNGE